MFGEDVGRSGGVFRVTDGLQETFGTSRVFDTPISEAGIAGAAVGLAFAGWHPVIEMQFDAFSYPAMEQIIDHVAKMRERDARPRGHAHHDPHPVVRRDQGQGAPRREPGDLLRAHGGPEGGGAVHPPRRLPPAAPRHRRSRPGRRAGAQGPLLGEGDGRPDDAGTRHRRGPPVARGRRLHDRDLRIHGGALARGRRVAGRRGRADVACWTYARCRRWTRTCSHAASGRPDGWSSCTRRRARWGWGPRSRLARWSWRSTTCDAPVERVTGWDVPYPPASLEDRYLPSVARIAAAVRKVMAY